MVFSILTCSAVFIINLGVLEIMTNGRVRDQEENDVQVGTRFEILSYFKALWILMCNEGF